MEIRISVVNGDLADLESLDDWLRGEPELAGRVRLTGPPPREGELGGLAERIIIDAGPVAGAIALTLPTMLREWLRLHGRGDVTCEMQRPDGTKVRIAGKHMRDSEISKAIDVVDQVPGTSGPQAPASDTAGE